MSPLVQSILAAPHFHRFLYRFISIYSRTFRLRIENEARWQQLIDEGTPVLLCAWHQQIFSAISHFKSYAKYQPALMISRSRDGAIIAAVARQTGWKTVRGSSTRGGKPALRSMIRHLERSRLAAHILDGPTGPMGVVKSGAIRIAHTARATIIPFSVSAHRALYFNSWDRFMLPLPFSRVTLRFGDPVRFAPTNDPEAFERQRVRLEAMMAPCLVTGRSLWGKEHRN
ncbi:MAG: lysophospholipid acyltransferase family protein [Desulfosarcina sp.]|nr:lysophospholipid acyltransferase family protein [Desulfosarcina sp.]MBC2744589.1 lysophospholipid acyltransferase family protein [Desulfosarcina sp.]MBC2767499.1 lysophospholipid acyltransferase family protein [Desulfosarcina sp.]